MRSWRHLKDRYGITKESFLQRLLDQQYRCAISGELLEMTSHSKGSVVVDHCHTTGKVRGLIRHDLNKAMGAFNDDPELLRAAADYLEQHRKEQTNESL